MAGSERFGPVLARGRELRDAVDPGLRLHRGVDAERGPVDALTYEVVRHRLWAITEEMGEAIRRMSGSVVVTDANDFGVALMDELGDEVQVGLYNTQLCASMDMAVKWTLVNRSPNPGIEPGDMFLCNDPWVGGGIHQNDVSVFAPLFVGGELFAWSCAVAHQVDVGGVSPGSWSVHSRDVFWESMPTPPVKIVSGGRILRDVEDSYVRRSRMPALVALDLRAMVGANNVAHRRIGKLLQQYGTGTVKQVMAQMMDDAEGRLRRRLRGLPDGTWRSVAYQDQARQGDRGLYKIQLEMTKSGDQLHFDFAGTDRQVDGLINCPFSGLRGGIIMAMLTQLCGEIPWAPGGIVRCFDIESEPGTINNCTFPAGISKGSVASSWATGNAVHECVAAMLDAEETGRRSFMSVCKGSFGLSLLAGMDQYQRPFVTMLSDSMAGGMGARPDRDGVDTGGEAPIASGRIADIEMNEFSYPILYLWRREEMDTGGPGRFRGGLGGSACFVPHDTGEDGIHLVSAAAGKAVPQASGISGGYPANAAFEVVVRGSTVRDRLGRDGLPGDLSEIDGTQEIIGPALETDLGPDDVYMTMWQGGGGYGDPLHRAPDLVVRDVAERKVTRRAAREVYGVAIAGHGSLDEEGTERLRRELRRSRAGAAGTAGGDEHGEGRGEGGRVPETGRGRRLDDNLVCHDSAVACAHCGTVVGSVDDWLAEAIVRGRPVQDGGSLVPAPPETYVDVPVVFRQAMCPGCLTALLTEVAEEGSATVRGKEIR